MVAIIVVNIFGTLGYAEEEFFSAIIKLGATVIFMIVALVLVLGGGPKGGRYDHYYGAQLWYDPGAFRNGFRGFCSVFVTAAFSFSGTELVGLAAAEARNPVKSLPGAIKQVFWRITLFYIIGLFFVGLLVPSNDPQLLQAGAYNSSQASPFVLAAKYAGLKGFDDFMNLVILVSVLSIGVSSVYGGSRTLTALAQQGYAPKLFTYVDRSGRPLPSVVAIILFGFLAYISLSSSGPVIFNWLLALSGLAALFTWGSINLAHIRFRKAWLQQGHTLDEIPFKAAGGVWGSYLGLFLIFIVFVAQVCFFFFSPPVIPLLGAKPTWPFPPIPNPHKLTFDRALVLRCHRTSRGRPEQRPGLLRGLPGPAGGAGLLGRRLAVEARGLAAHQGHRPRQQPPRAAVGRDQRVPPAAGVHGEDEAPVPLPLHLSRFSNRKSRLNEEESRFMFFVLAGREKIPTFDILFVSCGIIMPRGFISDALGTLGLLA